MAWIYNNQELGEAEIESILSQYLGFVYCIKRIKDSKCYIGKKQFVHRTKSRISKREIAKTKTRKKIKTLLKDSGWQSYQSSCVPLQEDIKKLGINKFKFEILKLCKDKRELAYMEYKYMFYYNVLETDSYNNNIGGKFFRQKQ